MSWNLMGLEEELWLFRQNKNFLATRSEQSDKILPTSGTNSVYFAVPFSLGWGSRRKELPKEWQEHVQSEGGKCPFWASPSSTLLTSCYCWTVGSWMLPIKITSLASQNNPSSPQGSDPSLCRGPELCLMRLGAHPPCGPRAVQIALDALCSCVPPHTGCRDAQPAGMEQSEAVGGSGTWPCADLCMDAPQRGNPLMLGSLNSHSQPVPTNAMQGMRDGERSRTSRVRMYIELHFSVFPLLLAKHCDFFLSDLRNVFQKCTSSRVKGWSCPSGPSVSWEVSEMTFHLQGSGRLEAFDQFMCVVIVKSHLHGAVSPETFHLPPLLLNPRLSLAVCFPFFQLDLSCGQGLDILWCWGWWTSLSQASFPWNTQKGLKKIKCLCKWRQQGWCCLLH